MEKAGPQATAVEKAIRQAIRDSGLSLNELARRTGVSQPQLSRFMNEDRTLWLPAAARICEVLGLKLVKQSPAVEEKSTQHPKRQAKAAKRSKE